MAACLFTGLALTSASSAQNCDSQTLQEAQDQYKLGQFDDVTGTLTGCLDHFKTDDEKFTAYQVLARTYIAMDDLQQARKQIEGLLRIQPDYIPNRTSETETFANLVDDYKQSMEDHIADVLVTTANKRSQLSSDAPATIYVRTREQIVNRGYTTLLDLLEDIPEVEVQRNSISEFKNTVTLRGIAGSEKFIIMQNGVRITPPTGDPYSMGAQFSLANAKRVEIILGPASALYGADAFSGIINIITNDARDTKGGTVNTSYGQYATGDHSIVLGSHTRDLGFTVTAQVTHSQEPDYYNIYPESFSWYNDHYKPDGTVDINGNPEATPVSFDRSFEMPTRSYYLDAKANFGDFEIGALAMHERHSSSVSVDPRYSLYTKDAFIATQLQSGYARHVHTGKDDRWSLQSYISFCNTRMDPESNFINRFTGYEQGYKYQASQSQKIEEQWDYELTRNASVIAGFSIEDHSVLPKTADLPRAFNPKVPAAYQQIPYINTDTTDYLGNSLVIYQDFYYLHYQNYGTFAQLYNKWKWVELTVGGRFDYNTRFKSVFNPRMGLVVKPKDNLKLKLLYGQSFLAPSPWKAYSTYGSFQPVSDSLGQITGLESPFFHIPNPDLKPEKLQSLEGGVAFYKGKNFSAFADVYYNTISNLINIQSASTQTSFRGVSVTYAETANNEGVANTYGATFSGNYFLNLGEHRFNLYGSYSYSNGKIDGEPLVLSAMHTGKAGIDWTLGKWSASLRTLHRSASNSVLTKTSGDYYTSPAYTIYNLNARYALASQKHYELQLTLGIRNLTNVKYYNAAAGQDSFTITPQDPIRVCLGANLQFKP